MWRGYAPEIHSINIDSGLAFSAVQPQSGESNPAAWVRVLVLEGCTLWSAE